MHTTDKFCSTARIVYHPALRYSGFYRNSYFDERFHLFVYRHIRVSLADNRLPGLVLEYYSSIRLDGSPKSPV